MTPREEAQAILDLVHGDFSRAVTIVEHQLDVLHSRAQVLTGLAGVVVTVTGFSGRLIASTNFSAQVLVIAGLAIVLLSAFFVVQRVMRIQWVTREIGPDPVVTLETLLRRRDKKTRSIQQRGFILFFGLLFFFAAFALMLIHPAPISVPVR